MATAESPQTPPREKDPVLYRTASGQAMFSWTKERRRSSIFKVFAVDQGDYVQALKHRKVQALLEAGEAFEFADFVTKVNQRGRLQERILLITDQNLYSCVPGSFTVKRTMALSSLQSVTLSNLRDNLFVLHFPGTYDYLYVSPRKTEILLRLMRRYRECMGSPLVMLFTNKFQYQAQPGEWREVECAAVEGGVSTAIRTIKKAKSDF